MTSLIVVLLYGLWFIAPIFIYPERVGKAPAPHVTEVEAIIGEWKNQIILVIALTGIVALLGWWQETGFRMWHKGTLKFALFPLILVAVIFGGLAMAMGQTTHLLLGTTNMQQLLALIAVALMVGFTEETMFRGILQYGATWRFKPLLGPVIAALVFGLFHFVNLIGGQSMALTVPQVVHAAADGFMYGALRLITGSLYPVMLLHGVWDLLISAVHAQLQVSTGVPQASADPGISVIQYAPGLLYGGFVMWRWWVRQNRETLALAEV